MGTSHRHTPTVTGEPNWGHASAAVTGIAGAEEKLDDLEKGSEGSESEIDDDTNLGNEQKPTLVVPPAYIKKRQRQLDNQIRRNYHHAVRNLVRAVGGRAKVSSGRSQAIGHAGIAIANGLFSAIHEIVKNGLTDWLNRQGITSLEGNSCQNVLDLIRDYIETGVAGLDNTAANEALECVMDELGDKIGEDIGSLEEIMSTIMTSNDVKDLLDKFFGMYIFSHLSQNFKEKLEYEKGSKVMNETLIDIKELIEDDVRRNRCERDVSNIDWSSEEGKEFINEEFDRILYILSGNED